MTLFPDPRQERTKFNNIQHPKKRGTLAALVAAAVGGRGVAEAVRLAGVHRQRHSEWMKRDSIYATAVAEACELGWERFGREIEARAALKRQTEELMRAEVSLSTASCRKDTVLE